MININIQIYALQGLLRTPNNSIITPWNEIFGSEGLYLPLNTEVPVTGIKSGMDCSVIKWLIMNR
jgi:hypothetical protein